MADQVAHRRQNAVAVTLIAGLAGAGLALLLAPRTGRETRDKIKSSAHDIKHQAEEELNQAREMKERLMSVLKTHKDQAVDDLQAEKDRLRSKDNFKDSQALKAWEEEV